MAVAASVVVEDTLYICLTFRRYQVRVGGLLARVWRGLLAAGCMAGVLVEAGFGWTEVTGSPGELALHLAAAIALGGVVYVGVLLLAWLASGRPEGAEADAVAMSRRLAGSLRRAT